MNIALNASTVLPSLASLGARFEALSAEYDHAATICSGLIDQSDKDLREAGIPYGSTEWSCRRFALCGAAIRTADALKMDLEELAMEIARHPVASIDDLAVKARAHLALHEPQAILTDIANLQDRASATA
ncbi:hypothetical protein ACLE20_06875 [Rhizobium sp. YIM 134829]|uniref:hypothetical protein n=1 Tax=Rhizobium sp. YIM 134829 TaxID=3390453 RepID=UPI00397A7A65